MRKLIDADKIMDKMESTFDMQELYLPIHFKELIIDDMPSIEAIPKAEYKARLKADLKAILVELQLEIEEKGIVDYEETYVDNGECIISVSECNKIIQQKIDKLKGVKK